MPRTTTALRFLLLVVHDRRNAHQMLPGRSDTGNFGLGVGLFQEHVLGMRDILAPQVLGRANLRLAVVDPHINRPPGLALQDEQVKAGALHLGGKLAARVGARDRAGQRCLGRDHKPVARRGRCARQRAGGEYEFILRREGIHRRVHLVIEVLDRPTPSADKVFGRLWVYRFYRNLFIRQIDPEYLAVPSKHFTLLF